MNGVTCLITLFLGFCSLMLAVTVTCQQGGLKIAKYYIAGTLHGLGVTELLLGKVVEGHDGQVFCSLAQILTQSIAQRSKNCVTD